MSDGLATLGRPAGDGEIPAGQLIPGYPEVSQGVPRSHKGGQGVPKCCGTVRGVFPAFEVCVLSIGGDHTQTHFTGGQQMHSTIGDSGSNVANTIANAIVAAEYHNQGCRKIHC